MRCKYCSEWFTPSQYDLSKHEEGHTDRPDTCDECEESRNNYEGAPEYHEDEFTED